MPKKITTKRDKIENRRSVFVIVQEVLYLLLITTLSVTATLRVSDTAEQIGGIAKESVSGWSFLVAFAAMTVFVLFVLKSTRGTKLLGAMFALAVVSGIGTLMATYFGPAVGVISFVVAAAAYYTNPHVISYNLLLTLGLAGVSASVGFGFDPVALLVVMAVLSVYDVVAVYFTKHMVKLAKSMLRGKVFFAMILPDKPNNLAVRISDVELKKGFSFLGTGDMVLPALFTVSVASTQGLAAAIPVIAGSVSGLLITNAIFLWQKFKKPMPALPPIVLGCIAGYVITLITM